MGSAFVSLVKILYKIEDLIEMIRRLKFGWSLESLTKIT